MKYRGSFLLLAIIFGGAGCIRLEFPALSNSSPASAAAAEGASPPAAPFLMTGPNYSMGPEAAGQMNAPAGHHGMNHGQMNYGEMDHGKTNGEAMKGMDHKSMGHGSTNQPAKPSEPEAHQHHHPE